MRGSLPVATTFARTALAAGLLLALAASSATAQNFLPTTGTTTWNATTTWSTGTIPNSIGATAFFTNNATAARTATLDTAITVGSISIDNSTTFATSITGETAGTLTFNNGGAGATITSSGTGAINASISATTTLNDNLTINATNLSTNTAGALTWSAIVSGTGGVTKTGGGTVMISTALKSYSGPTVIETNTGRIRYSSSGSINGTGSVTVKSGAQLDLITVGTYTFGSVLNLNGVGSAAGTAAGAVPGAIRAESASGTSSSVTPIFLQDNASIGVVGAATRLTLSGAISNSKQLSVDGGGAGNSGTLILSGANTYSGGTIVNLGTLSANGAAATVGIGNVAVLGTSGAGTVRLQIQTGVLNALANNATLSVINVGGSGTVDLGAGVNETVGGLVLAGAVQPDGTYGATGSGAMNINDTFFTGLRAARGGRVARRGSTGSAKAGGAVTSPALRAMRPREVGLAAHTRRRSVW